MIQCAWYSAYVSRTIISTTYLRSTKTATPTSTRYWEKIQLAFRYTDIAFLYSCVDTVYCEYRYVVPVLSCYTAVPVVLIKYHLRTICSYTFY
jgi:hypothetical protein